MKVKVKVVRHAIDLERPWQYTTVKGQVRRYAWTHIPPLRGDRKRTHLFLESLCFRLTGRLVPMHEGDVENRTTRDRRRLTCRDCLRALDAAMERGLVKFLDANREESERGFHMVITPPVIAVQDRRTAAGQLALSLASVPRRLLPSPASGTAVPRQK